MPLRIPSIACVLLFLMSFSAAKTSQAQGPFELKDGDRVVFLGSEFIEQATKHNFLEAALTTQWPDRRITFRNLGWAGDNPTAIARGYFGGAEEGYRRLVDELERLQPTVVFVFYGANASYGTPDDIPPFIENMKRLIADLRKQTDRIVIVSPPPMDKLRGRFPDPNDVNENRRHISLALEKLAAEEKLRFVDIYRPMGAAMASAGIATTYDTIRFDEAGYSLFAVVMLKKLQLGDGSRIGGDRELRQLIKEKNDLYFHRYRPQNETYLRGFRKHEQGQNAIEIAEFDSLIEQADARIAAFVQGKPLPAPVAEPPPREQDFEALTPEQQKEQFTLDPALEIELFAAEPLVKNPIHMNFDCRGRLWIASSPIYPQIRPGGVPSDEIIVLEDTDQDGRADKKTVFADKLLIPTAVLPDERGGAFVANSTELLHLIDENGDGRADERRVILAGFGTEDTHHILHTFRWSPDALLCFNQSIYIHSHVETPYGVQQLLGSGIWRYRPQTARATTVMYGLINPWGHVFNQWGQSFATDGAGGEGINYAFPGAAYPTAVGYNRVLHGMNPGQPKHCGLEIISSRHFPDDWQGTLVTADFRGNRVNRFQLSEQGSGYNSTQLNDVMSCRDRAFRPVDLKMGPDGALYIADWHNPIINHGEVDFRDPRRDVRHGRIWRVTVRERDLVSPPQLAGASIPELIERLSDPELRTRQMARVQLTLRDHDSALAAVSRWVASFDPNAENLPKQQREALWATQALGRIPVELLDACLTSTDHHVRAAAVRALSQGTQERFGLGRRVDVLSRLRSAIQDEHPQVRLEAVNALRQVGSAEAAELAMTALDFEMDEYLDFALWQTLRTLQDQWLPRLADGTASFSGDIKKTLYAVKAVENPAALPPVMKLLNAGEIPETNLPEAFQLVGRFGNAEQLREIFNKALSNTAGRTAALAALIHAASARSALPSGDLNELEQLVPDPYALHLAGLWRLPSLHPILIEIAESNDRPLEQRRAAILGLAAMTDKQTLSKVAQNESIPRNVRRLAVNGLLPIDGRTAAEIAVGMLSTTSVEQTAEVNALLDGFLKRKEGPPLLADALKEKQIDQQIASLAVRHAQPAGQRAIVLINALRAAGGLKGVSKEMSTKELAELLQQVESRGNPARGEFVFRNQNLACFTCHSIGGAGGLAGPDLLSLGASSPVDYIVQSLLDPSAKIKENYHTTTIATIDGKVVNGIAIRQGDNEIVLRDADNHEITILKDDIDQQVMSPTSLMPANLIEKLPRDEFVDLVAFLSSLGKDGPYKVPQNRFVRRWIPEDGKVLFSRVDGSLPASDIPGRQKVSFEIDVTNAGTIALAISDVNGLRITRGRQEDNLRAEKIVVDLPVGRHRFTIEKHANRKAPLKVEVVDVPGSSGHAVPVNRIEAAQTDS